MKPGEPEMGENRAVVAVLVGDEIVLHTSPDLPEGEEGLAVRGATTSPDLPEGEEGLAVRDGRERRRYGRLQRGGRCGASVSTNVPNQDLRPKVTSTSTRLTAAG